MLLATFKHVIISTRSRLFAATSMNIFVDEDATLVMSICKEQFDMLSK